MILLKLLILPLVAILTVLEWVGIFITQFAGRLFQILSGAIFLLSIAVWVTGLDTGPEVIRTLVISFVFFILPLIGERLVTGIASVNLSLKNLLRA